MASHHSDDEHEVSYFEINDKNSYDELKNTFRESHEECLILSKTYSKQKKIIMSLESKTNDTKVEFRQSQNFSMQ